MAERMFASDSYGELKTVGEARQAVLYLANNEITFRSELIEEGLTYDAVELEVKKVWKALLEACAKVKYKDYTVLHKEAIYKDR